MPYPPQSNNEGMKEQKCAILSSLKWGRGGQDVPVILSKIVASPYMSDLYPDCFSELSCYSLLPQGCL